MIERIARALCREGGFNPDEIMPNDGPRWKYYAPGAQAVLTELSAGDGVQQVDREAAQGFWNPDDLRTPHVDDIRSGRADQLEIVQAFFRHRTLAAAAERARRDKEIVEWLRGHEALSRVGDKFTVLMANAIEAGEV